MSEHAASLKTAHDVARANSRTFREAWSVVRSTIADLYTAMPTEIVPPGRKAVARYSSGRKCKT